MTARGRFITLEGGEGVGKSTQVKALAQALNERGMLTPRGGRWHKSSVRNLMTRIARA